jgi:hypothetical protein
MNKFVLVPSCYLSNTKAGRRVRMKCEREKQSQKS